jgi:hypothetical protein
MTLLDNCIDYLTTLRNEGDEGVSGMDDGAIQREANRMANVLVDARQAFMTHDLDTTPEA